VTHDVLVVGAGIVGSACALALGRRGARVLVLERGVDTADAATRAAAGIVSAQLDSLPAALQALARASRDLYPAWVDGLDADVGFRRAGAVRVAFDETLLAALGAELAEQRRAGFEGELLDARALRALEPALGPDAIGGTWLPDELLVDPPRLLDGARAAAERAGARFESSAAVAHLAMAPGKPVGVRGVVLASGERRHADLVVLCGGAWSTLVGDLASFGVAADLVQPARGQMIELVSEPQIIRHAVDGPDGYLSPRVDGRVLVGSTVEYVGFERAVTAGAAARLLAAALRLAPALERARLSRTWCGFRAATPDGLPILGRVAPGLVLATGHFRLGVTLAPITAEIVASLVAETPPAIDLRPFAPARFSGNR
jgi:glycine oxidase